MDTQEQRRDPSVAPMTVRPVALVTGGAVRVGRALVEALAEDGWDVLIHYGSSEGPARELAARVRELGVGAVTVQADLTDPRAAAPVIDAAREAYGRLDLLVNNAAGFEELPLARTDADTWDRVMALNVRAPHLLVREAAPLLRASRGSVVNLVDLSATQPWTAYAAHSVSKAALAHLTRVQARDLAPEVRVNAVAPGPVLPPDHWSEEEREALRLRTPLRRWGSPDDVARAVLYLARAPFVTGHVLTVDGGRLVGPAPGEGTDAVDG